MGENMKKSDVKKLLIIIGFSVVGVSITQLCEWSMGSWLLGWTFGTMCLVVQQLIDED